MLKRLLGLIPWSKSHAAEGIQLRLERPHRLRRNVPPLPPPDLSRLDSIWRPTATLSGEHITPLNAAFASATPTVEPRLTAEVGHSGLATSVPATTTPHL